MASLWLLLLHLQWKNIFRILQHKWNGITFSWWRVFQLFGPFCINCFKRLYWLSIIARWFYYAPSVKQWVLQRTSQVTTVVSSNLYLKMLFRAVSIQVCCIKQATIKQSCSCIHWANSCLNTPSSAVMMYYTFIFDAILRWILTVSAKKKFDLLNSYL